MFDWHFWRPYRPNPFVFIASRLCEWLFPWFYVHNTPYVYKKFHFKQITISPNAEQVLTNTLQPGHHLMVSNHICFMDPHTLIEIFHKTSQVKPLWMTSIDSIEGMRGFMKWYLSLVGVFSIDRGVLDKRSIQYAQAQLNKAKYPIMVFAEGEADYNQKVLRPYYSGACLLALNTAMDILSGKLKSDRPVLISPLVMQYPFANSPEKSFIKSLNALLEELNPSQATLLDDLSPQDALMFVLKVGLKSLARDIAVPLEGDVKEQLATIRFEILKNLSQEHLPEEYKKMGDETIKNLDFNGVMDLKNQLRSQIARKVNVPFINETAPLVDGVKQLSLQPNAGLSLRLEKQFIGLTFVEESDEKRLSRLKEQLRIYQKYQALYQQASLPDRNRWKRQLNQTRQAKMLLLIEEDIARGHLGAETSWDDLDETLVKMEIMFCSWFRYRGPRQMIVDAAPVINVIEFVKAQGDKTKKDILLALTEKVYQDTLAVLSQYKDVGVKLKTNLTPSEPLSVGDRACV